MGTRLFIGNLSYAVTEQELREAFTGDGIELRSVRVALDRETGRPRGFAFVETMTDEGAKASIEKLSGRVLQGRSIIVEEAQAKPAGPRPGGFGGPPRPGGFGGPPRPGGPAMGPGGPPRGPWAARVVPALGPAASEGLHAVQAEAPGGYAPRGPGMGAGRRRHAGPAAAAPTRRHAASARGREEEVDATQAGRKGTRQLALGPQPRRRVAVHRGEGMVA